MGSELWERIRALRKHLKLSGEEFGRAVGGSKAAVSQWEAEEESKRTSPDLKKVIAMKRQFEVPLDWLLDDNQPANHEWWGEAPVARAPLTLEQAVHAVASAVMAAPREARPKLSSALSSLALAPDSLELQVEISTLLRSTAASNGQVTAGNDLTPKVAVLSARLDSIRDPARRQQAYALLRSSLQELEEYATSSTADSPSPKAPPPQPGTPAPAHAKRK